jgi:diguanylate cyclase (GGDEF)-like protein
VAGDELLRALAVALAQSLRGTDTLARYGGEEFAVILPETDLDAGFHIAERLRRLIEHLPLRPSEAGGKPVTISLGVSAAPHHALAPSGLVNAADIALYQAKARGKNQTVVYDEALVVNAPGA